MWKDCLNRGECDYFNGVCKCFDDYSGNYCQNKNCINNCNNNGYCNENGTCTCKNKFIGNDCSKLVCEKECLNGGFCINDKCTCLFGYKGDSCELIDNSLTSLNLECSKVCLKGCSNSCPNMNISCLIDCSNNCSKVCIK